MQERTHDELAAELQTLREEVAHLRNAESTRRETEKRLVESEARYRALTQNMPLGLYRRTCGPGGRLVMVNPALAQIFGYAGVDELRDIPVADLYWDPSECAPFSEKISADGQIIKRSLKMKRKDGTPIWIAVTGTVVCDETGKPMFIDGIMEDITDRKRAAEESELRQQQLMQADKMITLGILVSGVAHEINNPNQFIASHISILRKMWEDALPILEKYYRENGDFLIGGREFSVRREQTGEMFQGIVKGSRRIKSIVDELRDYARESPFDVSESVDVNNIVKSALALLENLIEKSTNRFSVRYGANLPLLKGDYQRLEQVLINLVQNACQALPGPDSAISVETSYKEDEWAVAVQVTDEGCGIPEKNLKRVTDPFFTTKRDMGGTGLGLSISAAIVDKHGGRLRFKSKEGHGTSVTVLLPVSVPSGGRVDSEKGI